MNIAERIVNATIKNIEAATYILHELDSSYTSESGIAAFEFTEPQMKMLAEARDRLNAILCD